MNSVVRHGDIGKMKDAYIKMKELLKALINYTNKSGNFNPHFYKNEIMDSLSISEGEFNIIQKSLGDKYCHYVDSHGGSDRYSINMSECLALQEQHDQEFINEKRHKQLVRLAVLIAVLGATLGATLSVWFSKEG